MAEILADDMCNDDRRRVVGAGVLHGRDADIAHMRAIADVGVRNHNVDRHRDPRRTPRPESYSLLRSKTRGPRRSTQT